MQGAKMTRFNFIAVIITISISSVFFSLTSFAVADKSEISLPQGVLTASQINQLVQGKTVVAMVEGKDRDMAFFFGKDGKLQRVRDGWQRTGKWEVREDGRLCTKLKGASRDCRIIVKQDQEYRQYAVKKDGNHRYEITYTKFLDGEKLAAVSYSPLLPEGTLKRKKIVELFSGHTVESVTASKGRVSQSYYNPDGTLEQRRDGAKRYGKWRVTKNARMCMQMESLEEKCRVIVEEDGAIKKYIVQKNGRHKHSVSYRNFTPGKSFK
jgi:hypothetical protein